MMRLIQRHRALAAQAASFVSRVDDLSRRHRGRPVAARQMAHAVEETVRFVQAHRVGVLGKALLANRVKWGLRELGHDEGFVDETTEILVLRCGGLLASARA